MYVRRDIRLFRRPPVLDDLGLLAALDLLAQERGTEAGTPITLDADSALAGRALAPAAQLVLYRAAQESLNNCLRHAHPRTIEIALQRHGALVRLRVSDDGGGFAAPARLDALVAHGHHGLAGLQARVQSDCGDVHTQRRNRRAGRPSARGDADMIRVLLVDDHKLLLQGTRDALRAAADIAVVAEAAQLSHRAPKDDGPAVAPYGVLLVAQDDLCRSKNTSGWPETTRL